LAYDTTNLSDRLVKSKTALIIYHKQVWTQG
jgi:hypothetical protein